MKQELTRNPLTAIGRRNALLVALSVPLTFGQCQADQGARTSTPPPAQGPSSRSDSVGDQDGDEEDGVAARP